MSRKLPPMMKSSSQKNKVEEVGQEWSAERYLSAGVTLEEIRQIKAAFDIFDSDHTGYVDPI